MRPLVSWTAVHVFGIQTSVFQSRWDWADQIAGWLALFCVLVIAGVATAIWSVMDRRRYSYPSLSAWFRLFIRFCLASQLIGYGLVKVVPVQMVLPLYELVMPFGDFVPRAMLWAQIGSSHPYETALGCAELVSAALLVSSRTTTAGALLSAIQMAQVFILNMTFGIPAKVLSFHLLLLSLFLLAPESKRLVRMLFLNRAVGPSAQRPLFRGHRANRVAVVLQVALGLWLVGWHLDADLPAWHRYANTPTRMVLYGIWAVDEFRVDGRLHPPLTTDVDRWQRLIIDRRNGVWRKSRMFAAYQHMDGSLTLTDNATIDTSRNTVTLAFSDPTASAGTFTFTLPAEDQLTLDGQWNRHPTHMQLHRLQLDQFNLINSGFSWVAPYVITHSWN
jgi:hypothetical protein